MSGHPCLERGLLLVTGTVSDAHLFRLVGFLGFQEFHTDPGHELRWVILFL